jgi:hypothetical protein
MVGLVGCGDPNPTDFGRGIRGEFSEFYSVCDKANLNPMIAGIEYCLVYLRIQHGLAAARQGNCLCPEFLKIVYSPDILEKIQFSGFVPLLA